MVAAARRGAGAEAGMVNVDGGTDYRLLCQCVGQSWRQIPRGHQWAGKDCTGTLIRRTQRSRYHGTSQAVEQHRHNPVGPFKREDLGGSHRKAGNGSAVWASGREIRPAHHSVFPANICSFGDKLVRCSRGTPPRYVSFGGIMQMWSNWQGPQKMKHKAAVAVVRLEGMIVDGSGPVARVFLTHRRQIAGRPHCPGHRRGGGTH